MPNRHGSMVLKVLFGGSTTWVIWFGLVWHNAWFAGFMVIVWRRGLAWQYGFEGIVWLFGGSTNGFMSIVRRHCTWHGNMVLKALFDGSTTWVIWFGLVWHNAWFTGFMVIVWRRGLAWQFLRVLFGCLAGQPMDL